MGGASADVAKLFFPRLEWNDKFCAAARAWQQKIILFYVRLRRENVSLKRYRSYGRAWSSLFDRVLKQGLIRP
jgi:hypothetical protein